MKKMKLTFFLLLLFFTMVNIKVVEAKEIAKTCKYQANEGYNTIYIDIYDDNTSKAYVKKFLNSTEGDGRYTTYDGNGNKEDVQNWNNSDTTYLDNNSCPAYALITDGALGFDVYASDDQNELEDKKGNKKGYILDNDKDFNENFAICEYQVPHTSDSYLRFKIEIKDENYTTMYYMKNGEENYYNSNFDKLLLNPTVFDGGASMINDIGSNITSEQIYNSYQNNGNTCPYIITTYSGGSVSLSVSNDPYHDGVNSFSSTLINSEYSEAAPEQAVIENSCVSHYNKNAIPAVEGAEFTFNIYSDNRREFCVKLEGWNQSSCASFNEGESPSALNITTDYNQNLSFVMDAESVDDFFSEQCIGNNFYVYEEAGIAAGIYILTTDAKKAEDGTYYTQGEEGPLESNKDQHGFNPNRLCEDGNCDISLNGFCGEPTVSRVLKFIGLVIFIAKILVPAIIIIMGFVTLFKIMTSGKEDEAKKQVKNIIRNIVIGILIFLLPSLINFVFDIADDIISPGETSDFSNCVNCLTDPNNSSKCIIQESDND